MRRPSGTFVSIACASVLIGLAGCGQQQQAATPAPTGTPIGAAAADAEAQAAADAKAAELAAKERELADREAALKQQELEAEVARLKAENAAAAEAAAKQAAASKPAPKPSSTSATAAAPKSVAPITVPAGTRLDVTLSANVNTKKALVGDPVQATLASNLMIDGRKAASAGAAVRGSVTQVISGSDKIGGTPTIGLRFDTLVAADGKTVTINAPYTQTLKSETGKDTAKILGGAAAGAIIGHQIDNDSKGSVIGGLVGAGAGAAAAKKTGLDIKLQAGQVLSVSTGSSFEVKP